MNRRLSFLAYLPFFASSIVFISACKPIMIPTADQSPISVAAAIAPTETRTLLSSETPTVTPTLTPTLAPTETPTITPTFTASPTPRPIGSPTVKPTSTRAPIPTAGTMKIKLFFVALNDNGKSGKRIGCDDSIVAVDRTIPSTSAPLTAALKEIFSVRERFYGPSGLYNSLSQTNLKLDGVTITEGKATINLSGTVLMFGTCDSPRLLAQIQETALQFPPVTELAIMVGKVPIEQLFSLRGG